MMRYFVFPFIIWLSNFFAFKDDAGCQRIIQKLPSEIDEEVIFELECMDTGDLAVDWSFGDGSPIVNQTGKTVSHTFAQPGIYTVFARFNNGDPPISINHTVIKPKTPNPPSNSATIVMDHKNDQVWNVNADNNSITCIDALTMKKKSEVKVGKHPRTLSLDKKGNVWVANQDDASISIVSSNGELLETIELPYASRPYGICISPDGSLAYITLQGTGRLLKISTAEKHILNDIAVNPSPRGIAVTHDGQYAYITRFISDQGRAEVIYVRTDDLKIEKNITLRIDNTPDFDDNGRGIPNFISSLTISPDGEEIWVPGKKDNVLRGSFRDGKALNFENTVRTITAIIDAKTNEETFERRMDFNDSDLACAATFSPFGNLIFIATQGNNKVEVVNAYTNSRVGRIVDTGLAPQGMAFNQDGSKLFIHNFMSRTVSVYDVEDVVLSNAFEPVQLTTIKTISNEILNDEVLLGKQIFYNAEDERMSKTGYISCASCHLDGESDERVWDFTDRGEGLRNTHSLLGKGGVNFGNVHWTGNFDEIQDFENDIRNGFGGKGFMSDVDFNTGTRDQPLGDEKKGVSDELDALAAYVSSLDKMLPSPYRHRDGTLTSDGLKGKVIFNQLNCNECHSGENFTDKQVFALHDVGTIKAGSGKRINEKLTGFVTPTLKGLWHTAPYLHDGSAATLKDVLVTANQEQKHGLTLNLTDTELNQLISYLKQIDVFEKDNSYITGLRNPNVTKNKPKVYPNPASDVINLNLTPGTQWIIMDSAGRIIMSGNQSSLSTANFPSGIYIIKTNTGSAKFVIE
ncbi:PKD domain-containing protein [Fulvivirgaceae bacterium BMA10]|uniref:PKD domain-containing protein n=1 Tax=Splendidivirga corallicola TaxID=3051826 RepID=A0ABT8KND7_9BACT|nr:PKD domain-containing protein [Fulvivirgaceae bacterium BMA10]